MSFQTIDDMIAIENACAFEDLGLEKTLYRVLSKTAQKFPQRPAVTFQLMSGPKDPAETMTWSQLHSKTTQAANMFRALGVGPSDVVAYILPNSNETVLTLLGGAVAGIVNPINPLLEHEQMGAILRETNAKVVVTLKAFPKTDIAQKTAAAVALAPNVTSVIEIDLNRG